MTDLIQNAFEWLVGLIDSLGYLGIFVLMTIESSFIPFPSEVVMIPAGILAGTGEMDLAPAMLAGVGGSILGAWINYFLAVKLGRALLLRLFGRFALIPESKMVVAERYFERHGEITTLVCRLIPGVRQLISIPAGLARMNLWRFTLFTGIGAGAWVATLTLVGFWAGHNQQSLEQVWAAHKRTITAGAMAVAVLLVAGYVVWHRWRVRRDAEPAPS